VAASNSLQFPTILLWSGDDRAGTEGKSGKGRKLSAEKGGFRFPLLPFPRLACAHRPGQKGEKRKEGTSSDYKEKKRRKGPRRAAGVSPSLSFLFPMLPILTVVGIGLRKEKKGEEKGSCGGGERGRCCGATCRSSISFFFLPRSFFVAFNLLVDRI